MSKQVLDIQQMQHLKKLGLDTSNASMVCIYTDCNCDVIEWDDVMEELGHPEPMEMFKTLHDAETGNYDHSYRKYCGVFTLQDILDLIPRSVDAELLLFIDKGENKWRIGYTDIESNEIFEDFSDKNFIDAAYEILCWCAENGFVKTNKED